MTAIAAEPRANNRSLETKGAALEKQHLTLKRVYPHVLLLHHLPGWYELYHADAETASRALELTLSSRPTGPGAAMPMACIPERAIERHIARLVAHGYRVGGVDPVSEEDANLLP